MKEYQEKINLLKDLTFILEQENIFYGEEGKFSFTKLEFDANRFLDRVILARQIIANEILYDEEFNNELEKIGNRQKTKKNQVHIKEPDVF